MPPSPIEQAAVAASPKMRSRSRSRSRLAARRMSSIGLDEVDHMDSLWGVTLSSTNREFVWSMKLEKEEGVEDEDEDDRDYILHTLFLKVATLGAGLTKGEEHVVEIEAKDSEGKLVKIPILNMAAGVNPMVNLNFEFSDSRKVTFRLTHGTGPLHLSGLMFQGHPGEFDMNQDSMFTETVTSTSEGDDDSDEDLATDEDEESVEEEEEEEEEEETKGKKQKAGVKRKTSPVAAKGKAKKARVEEESDEEEGDEDEMEVSVSKKKKGKVAAGPKGKSPKEDKAAKEKKRPVSKQKPKAK